MEKELKKVFLKIKYQENAELAENIWLNIIMRKRRLIRIKLWAFSSLGLVSFVGLIPAWKSLLSNMAQSGFYEYLSLAFMSGGSIFSYWKEFALSIAESLPIMSITISLSLIFVFFLSTRFAVKQIINNNNIGNTYGTA